MANLVNLSKNVDEVEQLMLNLPQVECSVSHTFAPGLYLREVFLPGNTWAIGHYQNFEQLNVMVKGKVEMYLDDGTTKILEAPQIFMGKPGRKVGFIIEDTVWYNVYNTDERDINKLESFYLTKSEASIEANKQPSLPMLTHQEDYALLLTELNVKEEDVRIEVEDMSDHIDLPFGKYKFQLSESPIEGNGIFAVGTYNQDEIIGPALLDNKRTILGRRINHSSEPNAIMIPHGNDVYLHAMRDLTGNHGGKLGEEITIDYRFTIQQRRITCQQ